MISNYYTLFNQTALRCRDLSSIDSLSAQQKQDYQVLLLDLKNIRYQTFASLPFWKQFFVCLGFPKNPILSQMNQRIRNIEKQVLGVLKREETLHQFQADSRVNFIFSIEKLAKGEELLEDEYEKLNKFFNSLNGKNNFNQLTLGRLLKEYPGLDLTRLGLTPQKLDQAKQLAQAYFFAVRKQGPALLHKIELILDRIEKKQEIKKDQKLTLQEFSLLKILPKLPFSLRDTDSLTPHIQQTLYSIERLNEVASELKEKTQTNLPLGTLLFEKMQEFHQSRGRSELSWTHFIQKSVTRTPYCHVGLSGIDTEGVSFESHIIDTHEEQNLAFADFIVNDCFVVDTSKLVLQEQIPLFEASWGKDWAEKLQKRYEERFNYFLTTNSFESIENPKLYRALSVLKRPDLEVDYSPKEFTFSKRSLLCSQFVARSVAYVWEHLKEEVEQQIEGLNLMRPFPTNMNFASLHPGALHQKMGPLLKKLDFTSKLNSIVDLG